MSRSSTKSKSKSLSRAAARELLKTYFTKVFESVAGAYGSGPPFVQGFSAPTPEPPKPEDPQFSSRIADIRLKRAVEQRTAAENDTEREIERSIEEYRGLLGKPRADVTESFTAAHPEPIEKRVHIRNAEKDKEAETSRAKHRPKHINWEVIKAEAAMRARSSEGRAKQRISPKGVGRQV
jgi:hypothetical protein